MDVTRDMSLDVTSPLRALTFSSSSAAMLSTDIDTHHRAFLTSEGAPKEESFILLRVHIIDFLFEVAHAQKFRFRETESVLSASVESLPGFDPRKSSSAFENLAHYARNLLEQPWRKEFHRIKMTSGFWIHNIRAHLRNAQEMLALIGYVTTDPLTLTLVRPPSTEMLIALSRDCYIASQECLLVQQIWEALRKDLPNCDLTLREVVEIRKCLVGDIRTVVSYCGQEAQRREREVEEATAHLRANGLALEHFQSQKKPRTSSHAYVPVAQLIDVDPGICHSDNEDMEVDELWVTPPKCSSENSQSPSSFHSQTPPTKEDTVSRHDDSCASDELISELIYEDELRSQYQRGQEVTQPRPKFNFQKKAEVTNPKPWSRHSQSEVNGQRSPPSLFNSQQPRSGVNDLNAAPSLFGSRSKSEVNDLGAPPSLFNSRSKSEVLDPKPPGSQFDKYTRSEVSDLNPPLSQVKSEVIDTIPVSNHIITVPKPPANFPRRSEVIVRRPEVNGHDINLDSFQNGKALTRTKMTPDFDMDSVETAGTGILNRILERIPSRKSLGQFFGFDVPTSGGGANNGNSNNLNSKSGAGDSAPWDCPHCTYVNLARGRVCAVCYKSRDFALPY